MRKKLLKSAILVLLLGISFSAFGASTPAADDGKWYYVKSQRGGAGLWWTLNADPKIVPNQLAKADNQKFTLVTSSSGKVTVKSFDGKLMVGASSGLFDATGTSNGWTILLNEVNGIKGYAFPGEGAGLHQYNAGHGWKVASGWYDLTDNCTFFFYEATANVDAMIDADDAIIEKVRLKSAIDAANSQLTNTSVGANPGQFKQADKDTYQAAVTTAQSAYETATTKQAVVDAIAALNTAKIAFMATAILPTISTDGNEVWYFIQGTRPANTYMTSEGVGGFVPSRTVIPDETQLWKLVQNTNGTKNGFALVNKVTGEYINVDVVNNTKFKTQAAMPNNNLKFRISNQLTNKAYRFWIENASGSTPALRFHAGGQGHDWSAMNYTGNENDNCTWLFLDYTTALRVFLQNGIDAASNIIATTKEGTDFGQYPVEARTTLEEAIAAAQTVYNNQGATNEELIAATDAMNDAIEAYKLLCNTDLNTFLSDDSNYVRWYVIKSTAKNDPGTNSRDYIIGKVISSTGRVEGQHFTYEYPSEPVTDEQMFRGVFYDGKIAFVNRANSLFLGANGVVTPNPTTFDLNLLEDAYSFNIKSATHAAIHAQNNYQDIVSWPGLAGTPSAWVFEFVEEALKAGEITKLSNSVISIERPEGTMWYNGSANVHDRAFDAAYLGNFGGTIILGGEVQSYAPSDNPLLMFYQVNNGEIMSIELPKVREEGINSVHAGTVTVDISGLNFPGSLLKVWFKAGEDIEVYDDNNGELYKALFSTITTGLNEAVDAYQVSVSNGRINVLGVENFEVYSVAGQKMNSNARLNTGIYIVKINNQALKVQVK